MYCLSFLEGDSELRYFYFHDFQKAKAMQKKLLIIEINNIVKDQCFGEPLYDDDEDNQDSFDLQRLLLAFIKIVWRDEYDDHKICINVTGLIFEDEPVVPIE
jgi:hypothetical protein